MSTTWSNATVWNPSTANSRSLSEYTCMEAVEKCLDARHMKSCGMRRTYEYAAITKDECNAADGRFPTAS